MNQLKSMITLVACALIPMAAFADKSINSTANIDGVSRDYTLYEPSSAKENAPLVVVLHGCFQTGQQIADGTRMNEWARKYGFNVVYPEQTYANNVWKCWNWFAPASLHRGPGELGWIAGITSEIAAQEHSDRNRVYVVGMSAGGAIVSNLLACYPDIFRGGIIQSGLAYDIATSETQAHDVMTDGPRTLLQTSIAEAYACSPFHNLPVRVAIFQGDKDSFVNPKNADRIRDQFIGLDSKELNVTEYSQDNSTIAPANTYNFGADVSVYGIAGAPAVETVTIHGMDHAWSGGAPVAPYMEPRGVDATQLGLSFLLGPLPPNALQNETAQ